MAILEPCRHLSDPKGARGGDGHQPHPGDCTVHLYLSEAYPLGTVLEHLSELATTYCQGYDVEQLAEVVSL